MQSMLFKREDWKLFRNIETLCQKAGCLKVNYQCWFARNWRIMRWISVAEAVRQVKERCGDSQTRLAETVPAELKKEPVKRWKDVVEAVSEEMINNCRS